MESTKSLNSMFAVFGEGLLLIWWGVVIVVDPLTIGIGAVGSGLILLGVNAARWLNGISTKRSTTFVGVIALVWGALDQFYALSFEASFAVLLIVTGAVSIVALLAFPKE